MEKRVRELLLNEWDPIGAKDVPSAQDEYDSYTGPILRLVRESATAEQIAAYLLRIEAEVLGLTPNPDAAHRAARKLSELGQQKHD